MLKRRFLIRDLCSDFKHDCDKFNHAMQALHLVIRHTNTRDARIDDTHQTMGTWTNEPLTLAWYHPDIDNMYEGWYKFSPNMYFWWDSFDCGNIF